MHIYFDYDNLTCSYLIIMFYLLTNTFLKLAPISGRLCPSESQWDKHNLLYKCPWIVAIYSKTRQIYSTEQQPLPFLIIQVAPRMLKINAITLNMWTYNNTLCVQEQIWIAGIYFMGNVIQKSYISTSYTLRKDFVILQLYWWLFSSTKHCG